MSGDETFGDLLRRLRTEAGLTQEELAERAGLSGRGISALERGINRAPFRATVQQLISALALPAEEAQELWARASRRRGPSGATDEPGPYRLPASPTSIVGRERELGMILHLLRWEGLRLITLTGTAGVGKTRLALEVARAVAAEFADGAAFVSLAAVSDPSLVPSAVAATLGVRPTGTATPEQSLQRFLADRELLLVLDNLEQVLSAGLLVAALLAGSPRLKVLGTSRASLQIQGEQRIEVPSLEVPPVGQWVSAEALARYSAMALFLQRSRAVHPALQPTDEQAGAIAEICQRLDGLPLAIELAAAQVKYQSPRALLRQLARRLDVLVGGARDLPARQQTMRDTIAWSYQLLDAEEQSLFRALSVFSGGCTREAVGAVWNQAEGGTGLELLLQSLVDKSLIAIQEGADAERRFLMLETIREYAAEQLAASGEREAAQERHARYFLALAERVAPQLTSEQRDLWFARLNAEQDNLRAALRWSIEQGADETGLRLAGALWRYWLERGPFDEGRRWLEQFLALDRDGCSPIPVRAQALFAAGALAYCQSDYARARAYYDQSLALQRDAGDQQGVATVLNALGALAIETGAYGESQGYLEESIALWRKDGPSHALGAALNNLANAVCYLGDLRRAAALYDECLAAYQACRLGRSPATANTWNNRAWLAMLQGDYERAQRLSEDSLALGRDTGFRAATAEALGNLGALAVERGDLELAETRYEEALTVYRSPGEQAFQHLYALTLAGLANLARARGDYDQARRLAGESLAQQEDIGHGRGIACALLSLGDAAREQWDTEESAAAFRRALRLSHKMGYLVGIAACLERLAWLGSSGQEPERAGTLGGAAEALRERMGLALTPTEEAQHREALGRAHQELGEMEWKRAWDRGRAMSREEAVACALHRGESRRDCG